MPLEKRKHDIAIGNVVGSNMFNLLAVIGIAGTISTMTNWSADVLSSDWLVMMAMTVVLLMMAMTVVLLMMAYGFRRAGRINRLEGLGLLLAFAAYDVWLVSSVIG